MFPIVTAVQLIVPQGHMLVKRGAIGVFNLVRLPATSCHATSAIAAIPASTSPSVTACSSKRSSNRAAQAGVQAKVRVKIDLQTQTSGNLKATQRCWRDQGRVGRGHRAQHHRVLSQRGVRGHETAAGRRCRACDCRRWRRTRACVAACSPGLARCRASATSTASTIAVVAGAVEPSVHVRVLKPAAGRR